MPSHVYHLSITGTCRQPTQAERERQVLRQRRFAGTRLLKSRQTSQADRVSTSPGFSHRRLKSQREAIRHRCQLTCCRSPHDPTCCPSVHRLRHRGNSRKQEPSFVKQGTLSCMHPHLTGHTYHVLDESDRTHPATGCVSNITMDL
jgi:hypothetical protein